MDNQRIDWKGITRGARDIPRESVSLINAAVFRLPFFLSFYQILFFSLL